MKFVKSTDVPLETVNIDGAKNVKVRWLIKEDDGAPNFAMRLFEVLPNGHTPLHKHPNEHEVFIVQGSGIFVYEGKEYPCEKGDVIYVDPNTNHCFKNNSDTLLKFLCLIPLK